MQVVGSLVFWAGILVGLSGVLTFGAQVLMWLRYGEWVGLSIGWLVDRLVGYPITAWHGAQIIINYLLSMPASVSLFAAGILIAMIGGSAGGDRK